MEIIIYMLGCVLSFIVGAFIMRKVGGEELTGRDIGGIMMFSLLSFIGLFFFGMFYLINKWEEK